MTNYQKLNNYINFKNKQEMNEHLTLHRQKNCYQLNETAKGLITYLSRYAVRYTGVAYLKVSTIAKTINKSERTVQRELKNLESLNIIKRYRNFRLLGGQGANIIQIQKFNDTPNMSPIQDDVKSYESKSKSVFFNSKPFNYSKHKELINTYSNVAIKSEVDRFLKVSLDEMTLHDKIKAVVSATVGIDRIKEISKIIYSNVNKALKLTTFKEHKAKVEGIALESLKTALNGLKMGKTNNLYAYLHGIINKKLDMLAIELINEVDFDLDLEPTVAPAGSIYNWLDE